jgi:hypothetical protein
MVKSFNVQTHKIDKHTSLLHPFYMAGDEKFNGVEVNIIGKHTYLLNSVC